MLSDRDYMREETVGSRFSPTLIALIVLGGCFILQQFLPWRIIKELALSHIGLQHWHLWQLFTYQFIHGDIIHLAFNLITLWFFGRAIEVLIGRRHFWPIWCASVIAGGLLQTGLAFLFPAKFGGSIVGASAGVCGLIAAFCLLQPNESVLLYFFIPLKAKWLLLLSLAVAVLFVIVPNESGVAHAAHLGGFIIGILYIWKGFHLRERSAQAAFYQGAPLYEPYEPARTSWRNWKFPRIGRKTEEQSDEEIRKEVDAILDKIAAQGIQSLTARERAILETARKRMIK